MAVPVVLLLVPAVWLIIGSHAQKVTRANFEKIKMGMTHKEINALLGEENQIPHGADWDRISSNEALLLAYDERRERGEESQIGRNTPPPGDEYSRFALDQHSRFSFYGEDNGATWLVPGDSITVVFRPDREHPGHRCVAYKEITDPPTKQEVWERIKSRVKRWIVFW
jgi:hypothetical protein